MVLKVRGLEVVQEAQLLEYWRERETGASALVLGAIGREGQLGVQPFNLGQYEGQSMPRGNEPMAGGIGSKGSLPCENE